MSSLLRIRQLYPRLALNERRLADFLLLQPDRARHLSSQKLAEESGVSQSSVVKFAQKLGYKGFPALKLALSESLADRDAITVHNHILSDDSLKTVGEKLLTEKLSAIRATLDINSEEKLTKTLHLLKNAQRIVLVGIGASGLVAKDFSWKLMKNWHKCGSQAGYACAAGWRACRRCGPATCCWRYPIPVNAKRLTLPRRKRNRLVLTCWPLPVLRLTVCNRQRRTASIRWRKSKARAAISSTTAQLALTDLLFMALVQNDPERAASHIRHSEALVKKLN